MGTQVERGNSKAAEDAVVTSDTAKMKRPGQRCGHARPLPVPQELQGLARLRVGHVMAVFAVSHSTLYSRLKDGTIPLPDGRDGSRPFWRLATIRAVLER